MTKTIETKDEIIKVKGRNVEITFKKGLTSTEFNQWLEDNNLVNKENKDEKSNGKD